MPTVRSRPSTFCPLSKSIAVLAISGVANSTNPKPRDLPVSRSVMTWALVTSPCGAKRISRSADVVLNARFPTWSLVEMACSLRSSAPSGLTPGRDMPLRCQRLLRWRASAGLALLRGREQGNGTGALRGRRTLSVYQCIGLVPPSHGESRGDSTLGEGRVVATVSVVTEPGRFFR